MKNYVSRHLCNDNSSFRDIVSMVKEREIWLGVEEENLECLICHLLISNQDVMEFYELTNTKLVDLLKIKYNKSEDLLSEVSVRLNDTGGLMLKEAMKARLSEVDIVNYETIFKLFEIAIICDDLNIACLNNMLNYYAFIKKPEKLEQTYKSLISATIKLANSPDSLLSIINVTQKKDLLSNAMNDMFDHAKEILSQS